MTPQPIAAGPPAAPGRTGSPAASVEVMSADKGSGSGDDARGPGGAADAIRRYGIAADAPAPWTI